MATSRLPGLPRQTLIRLGGDYTMAAPLLPDRTGVLIWSSARTWITRSDYYATINNVLEIESYTRYNARVGLAQTAQRPVVCVMPPAPTSRTKTDLYSGILGSGTDIRTPQPPRMFMLTVNYQR